jgi:hypothetical protein
MIREESIAKLKKAIDAKRKELGLRKEDSEKYRWMIDILKKKEAAKKRPAPNHVLRLNQGPRRLLQRNRNPKPAKESPCARNSTRSHRLFSPRLCVSARE